MTAPNVLAQCAGRCASISPSTSPEKLALAMGLVLLGVGVMAAIVFTLETPERRHAWLHRLFPAAFCGRCLQKQYADATDKAFAKSVTHSSLSQSVEAPR